MSVAIEISMDQASNIIVGSRNDDFTKGEHSVAVVLHQNTIACDDVQVAILITIQDIVPVVLLHAVRRVERLKSSIVQILISMIPEHKVCPAIIVQVAPGHLTIGYRQGVRLFKNITSLVFVKRLLNNVAVIVRLRCNDNVNEAVIVIILQTKHPSTDQVRFACYVDETISSIISINEHLLVVVAVRVATTCDDIEVVVIVDVGPLDHPSAVEGRQLDIYPNEFTILVAKQGRGIAARRVENI